MSGGHKKPLLRKGSRMSKWSVPSRHATDSNCAMFAPFVLSLAVVLSVACWQPCEAQQIPRRLDTSNYQNRGPTPPKLDVPGPFTIERIESPTTGKPIKVYQKPVARTLQRQQSLGSLPTTSRPFPTAQGRLSQGDEIKFLRGRVKELQKELSELSQRLERLQK